MNESSVTRKTTHNMLHTHCSFITRTTGDSVILCWAEGINFCAPQYKNLSFWHLWDRKRERGRRGGGKGRMVWVLEGRRIELQNILLHKHTGHTDLLAQPWWPCVVMIQSQSKGSNIFPQVLGGHWSQGYMKSHRDRPILVVTILCDWWQMFTADDIKSNHD